MTAETAPAPLRVVLYARLSTENAHGGTESVDQQLEVLRALAGRHDGRVVAERTDRAVTASGVARDRPGWADVLRMVDTGQVDAVGMWELSRSSRRLAEWATFRDMCRARGVLWLTPEGLVHPFGKGVRLNHGVRALIAEESSEETSERVRRDVRAAAAAGRPHGRETYGYRRVYDPATGALAGVDVHPDESAVVRRIVDALLAGDPVRRVAGTLNDDGILAPAAAIATRRGRPVTTTRAWSPQTVRKIALNRAYLGVRVHVERSRYETVPDHPQRRVVVDRAEHPAGWAPLVTEAEHAQLVALLNDPARNTRAGVAPDMRHYLNGGLLTCRECGGRLTFKRQRRGPDRWSRYYECTSGGCRRCVVDATVEDVVAAVLVARLGQPDALDALACDPAGADPAVAEARRTLAESSQRLDALAGAYADGQLSLAAYSAAEQRLSAAVAAARAAVDSAAQPRPLPEYARNATDPAAAWESWTPAQRNRVARALLDRIVVAPAGRRGRPPKGAAAVSPARLGWVLPGAADPVWGVDPG